MADNMDLDASSPGAMLTFYRRLYPFKQIFQWLNHDHVPSNRFTHREFAFTVNDAYIRYNSYSTVEEFKKQVIQLNPSRYEVGAVYTARVSLSYLFGKKRVSSVLNTQPRDKKTIRPEAFLPLQRELVFDIDMTDYDEIRTCCSGKGICKRCWGFIAAAVKVLDNALRDQFGYNKILWVYSGRRGIHCWVSDDEAMNLTDEQRKSILGWLEVIKGGKEMVKKVNIRSVGRPLHPAVK